MASYVDPGGNVIAFGPQPSRMSKSPERILARSHT
jgi:hypothetical protein